MSRFDEWSHWRTGHVMERLRFQQSRWFGPPGGSELLTALRSFGLTENPPARVRTDWALLGTYVHYHCVRSEFANGLTTSWSRCVSHQRDAPIQIIQTTKAQKTNNGEFPASTHNAPLLIRVH